MKRAPLPAADLTDVSHQVNIAAAEASADDVTLAIASNDPIEAPARKLPRLVILDDNFGFMINGCLRQWKGGDIVTDPESIAQLLDNGAPLKDLSDV